MVTFFIQFPSLVHQWEYQDSKESTVAPGYVNTKLLLTLQTEADSPLTLSVQNLTKLYRDYLHKQLRNWPSLPIPMESLTCQINDHAVQLLTLGLHARGPRFNSQALRSSCRCIFSSTSLPSFLGEIVLFTHFPPLFWAG